MKITRCPNCGESVLREERSDGFSRLVELVPGYEDTIAVQSGGANEYVLTHGTRVAMHYCSSAHLEEEFWEVVDAHSYDHDCPRCLRIAGQRCKDLRSKTKDVSTAWPHRERWAGLEFRDPVRKLAEEKGLL